MQIIEFERNIDPNDRNYGYLHVKIDRVGILRLIVAIGSKGNLFINTPTQYIKATGISRPWFMFESGIQEYEFKQEAQRYIDDWIKEHEIA